MDLKNFKLKLDFKNPATIGVIAGIFLLVIIVGAYYYFVYSGLTAKLNRKESMLQTVKAKYNSDLILVRSYPALIKRQKKLEKEFAVLVLELPSKKDIPGLLMKISNDEKVLNLNLKMFKPGKIVSKGFYEAVPFSMNISGSFYDVYKFFYKLAEMKRIVDVHNVSISKGSKGQMVSASFKGTTYSFAGAPPKAVLKKTGGVVKK